jgi:predicted  nucleic acid-binding Zn-ribbon protein
MNELLTTLLKLQALEFNETSETDVEKKRAELRALIPPPIMGHYDRLVARGKKGVAVVRNQVCTGCHMRLPIGTINTLMQGQDVQLCDTCGRYLYLPDPAETQFVENVAAAKPAAKTEAKAAPKARKRKALVTAP